MRDTRGNESPKSNLPKTPIEVAHAYLVATGESVEREVSLRKDIGWRPHLYQRSSKRAWYCLDALLETDRWQDRIKQAVASLKGLKIGLAGPTHILKNEQILLFTDEVNAAILPLKITDEAILSSQSEVRPSACDFIYQDKLRLSRSGAQVILDRNLARAVSEKNKNRKGVLLEVVTAVVLSQVDGFEVYSKGVSNRSQQMDVLVHNRNSAGALSAGEIVVAEAKNWTFTVGADEYALLYRKLETRHGRAKLGFFVTTDHFAQTVNLEMRRDSRHDILVIPLDKNTLPAVWRDSERSITESIEHAVIRAMIGQ